MDKNLENVDPWAINFNELDDAGVRVIPTEKELADMKVQASEEDACIEKVKNLEYSDFCNIGDFDDIKTALDNKVKANSKIIRSEIDDINKFILDEHMSLCEYFDRSVLDHGSLYNQADICENVRNKYNIRLDEKEIPAFVEAEIGSNLTPDDMRKEADALEKDMNETITGFYKNVHDLDNYDTSKLSDSDRRPVLITMATRDALGKGYEDYCEKSVQDLANNLASKYCMGIDTTKVAKTISNEVSVPLEKSNAKILPTEFEELYQESVENEESIEDDTQENPNGDGNFNQ